MTFGATEYARNAVGKYLGLGSQVVISVQVHIFGGRLVDTLPAASKLLKIEATVGGGNVFKALSKTTESGV